MITETAKVGKRGTIVIPAALSCKGDYLITGDVTHFGKYFGKRIRSLRICTPRDFFNIISKRSS